MQRRLSYQLFSSAAACRALFLVLLFTLQSGSATVFAGSSNSLMDISSDGTLLACSNRDSGTVSIVDLKFNKKLREVKVGLEPEGVSFLGSTHTLAVAVYLEDKIVFLDGDTGEIIAQTEVFDEPYSIVSNAAGDRVYVTLSYPGQVVEINTATHVILRSIGSGPFSRGLAIGNRDSRLYVTEFYNANVLAIDLSDGKIADRWNGTSSDNLSRQIALHPTRDKAYLSHIRSAVERAHGEGSIFPYVTVLSTQAATAEGQKRRTRLPMDSFINTRVTANPWEVAISPDGKRFFTLFSGTNDMFACDVVDDDYREIKYRATLELGNNPRAVRVSPDSKTFYVYNALDFSIDAYDVQSLRKTATISVTANPMSEEMLLGKRLFYTALQPMAGKRWISCSSCHIDGESDRRTWQNPEGLRDTPALFGVAWTHPLHWSADRDEVQDFEHTIRGQLMQGQGLARSGYNPEIGKPNKGISRELDALSAYTNSHKVPLSPHAKKGLSEAALRGREIFISTNTACSTCHSGPSFTDSTPGNKFTTHDVGTRPDTKDDPSEKKGPGYDTPTLLGIYKTAPYLHHGKAATLKDVLTTFNRDDRHGKTSQLKPNEISDLIEYLRALPYEDPDLQAQQLKMTKVER